MLCRVEVRRQTKRAQLVRRLHQIIDLLKLMSLVAES
jgi:hypothetical protein